MNAVASSVPKLIRLLGSDQDHEALSAARALRRVCNLNDLGDLLERTIAPPRSAAPSWRRQWRPDHGATPGWREMAQWLHLRRNQLNPRELGFVVSMMEWRGSATGPQREWLEAIFTRVRGRQ